MTRKPTLAELYKPSTTPNLDVVFVHGLGGDFTRTWTWQRQDGVAEDKIAVCWPRDLLPVAQPLTRVFSYGYNADVHKNGSLAGIRDHARTILERLTARRRGVDPKRPIIFVGHCLGGLIVKQAMRFATAERENFPFIATATCGLLFFGTPHFGSSMEQVGVIAERFEPMGHPPTAKTHKFAGLAKAIVAHSDDLKEISEDFRNLAPRYSITSWYETECWPGTSQPIVDISSARMLIPGERPKPVAADHLAMCQFEDAADETFQEVCESIQSAVEAGYSRNLNAGRNVVPAQQTPGQRPIHAHAHKIVIRAVEVQYEVSTVSEDDRNRLLPHAGRDVLPHRAQAQMVEQANVRAQLPGIKAATAAVGDAEDRLPLRDETDMAAEKVVDVKGRNYAARKVDAWGRLRPRKIWKSWNDKGASEEK